MTALTTTAAVGYGTCEGCHTTCTEVTLTTVTLATNGGFTEEQQYLCTARCVAVYGPSPEPFMFDLTEVAWVTATVHLGRSAYVVVARPRFGVRVICPSGEVLEGTHLHVVRGRMFLRDNNADVTVFTAPSLVTGVDVHEN